ncbi:Gfo/Idh/MocA family protein [Lutimonas sp.]|uniref:Gfo/Idh/MocA family protein n=1 Tax=Lutimonas sp. TaxID=1872403 RepID=UPI003C7113F3
MHTFAKQLNSIGWGIIGCGNVTEVKSGPAYQQTDGFELVAVMRRDLDKAEDYAKRHKVPRFYNDANTLINCKEVDAVYIATPPDSHLDYALQVAKAGKPCCIEKPMARNYKECLEIYNVFDAAEIPLFIAYYRRTLPRFLKIKEWLDSGNIGIVRHLNWVLSQPPNALDISRAPNWRTDIKVAPGGYFDDLASHGLDLFHFLLGEVKEASGFYKNQQGLYSAPDAVSGSLLYQSGVTGSGNWNFGSFNNEDKVEIFGSEGKISFAVFQEAPVVMETNKGREEISIDHPKHIQSFHVEAMKKHLTTNDFTHPSTGKTALHTSWIMDKILGTI